MLKYSIITNRPSLQNPVKKALLELLIQFNLLQERREAEEKEINLKIRKIYHIILIDRKDSEYWLFEHLVVVITYLEWNVQLFQTVAITSINIQQIHSSVSKGLASGSV